MSEAHAFALLVTPYPCLRPERAHGAESWPGDLLGRLGAPARHSWGLTGTRCHQKLP